MHVFTTLHVFMWKATVAKCMGGETVDVFYFKKVFAVKILQESGERKRKTDRKDCCVYI